MASEDHDVTEAALAPGARRQRPPSTIDLTATDVSGAPADPSVEAVPGGHSEPSIAPEAAPPPPDAPGPAEPAREQPADRAAPPPPVPPRERRRRPILAFMLGGALVAILAAALPWGLEVLAPRDSNFDELSARISGLELQLREMDDRAPAAAADQPAGALAARIDALSQQVARLEAAGRPDGAASPAAVAVPDPALAERLAATETAVRALDGRIADLRTRLDGLAATPPPPAAPPDQGAIDALSARTAALEAASHALDARLTATTGADGPGRVALMALELRVAVERGVPFATELAAAKPLIHEQALIDALEPVAATGVPTPQKLSRELADVSPAMLRAAGAPAHEGGLLERLEANASRLVRIRPIAETPGDDPSTIIVRSEVKATRGDIAGALAEISALPADVKAPAADWITSAQQRVAAVEAAQKFSVAALAALGKPAP